MTCVMCSSTTAIVYWTIVFSLGRVRLERTVCNACELEYRRGRRGHLTAKDGY